jgi:G3E family GTPase
VKTTIVCGVLGAGKTTFLKNILKLSDKKTVVLVNDFGSAGIDGEVLSAGGIETIELQSGCVCCSLRFDLIATIEKVMEQFRPDRLFIEPSGVASPGGVLEVLDILKIEPVTVVGIVDATEFVDAYEAEMYGWFFKSQVTWSDIILVNKTDLANEQKTEKTIQLIESLNQNAVIIPTVNAVLNEDLLQYKTELRKDISDHGHELQFETVTVKLDEQTGIEHLTDVFEKLAGREYGNVVRAKALVQTDQGPYRFDLASKQLDVSPFNRKVKNSRLVIIGTGLEEKMIRELID